jgi:hypothetical protein
VVPGRDGVRIRPDLVEDRVARDPVRTDDHGVDPALAHQLGRSRVGADRDGDAVPLQLERGQASALEQGPGLAGDHAHAFTGFDRRPDYAERSAPADAGERARIAVGQHGRVVGEERRAAGAERPVRRDVLVRYPFGLGQGSGRDLGGIENPADRGERPVHAPGQVDGRGPGRADSFGQPSDLLEIAAGAGRPGRERDAVRAGRAERGGAADTETLDGLDQRVDVEDRDRLVPGRDEGLVDQPEAVRLRVPPERPVHATSPAGHRCRP